MSTRRANLSLLLWGVVFAAGFFAEARAQTVISAAAGLVNYAEGRVFIDDSALHHDPTSFVHIKQGQRLRTERGRVELMLVPDVLLRLDAGAEIEMVSAELTDAHVRLLSGSCTIEVRRVFEPGVSELHLRNAKIRFDQNGLYRVTKYSDQAPSLKVFRGKASVATPAGRFKIKPNRSIRLQEDSDSPQIEKLDRLEFALLDDWTRVGDTGRRVATLGQSGQTSGAVAPTELHCRPRRPCSVPGLDCVQPASVDLRTLSFNGPRIGRVQSR